MTARRFLTSLLIMSQALRTQIEEIERLEAIATGTTAGLDEKVMSSSNGGKVASLASTIADMQIEYRCEFAKLEKRRKEIITALTDLLNGGHVNEYRVLMGMYVPDKYGLTKTLADVSEASKISYSTASKAHINGLDLVDEWLKEHWREENENQ